MGWVAAIMAGVSVVSTIFKWVEGERLADEERKRREEKKKRDLELMDLQFQESKREANKNADKSDEMITLSEAMLGDNAKEYLEQIGLGQEAKTLAYNQQNIENTMAEGEGYTTAAASGTRGSSTLQAVEMQDNLRDKGLQTQEDIDRKSSDLTLAGALNNLEEGALKLQQGRDDARDLRESFEESGSQYKLYKKRRDNYSADMDSSIAAIDYNIGAGEVFDMITAATNDAVIGYEYGAQIKDYFSDWKWPKLNKNPKQKSYKTAPDFYLS